MYEYVAHTGVKGMKWGQRQYQNKDGSLTPLGRAHYGVGAARKSVGQAAGKVKEAIRKKVAPTNAELNAQIRKQRSKNLNRQKREELSQLKKGVDPKEKSKSEAKGTQKKFYEMSDKEIQDRINRLTNEIKLADLEFETSLGPGQRFAYGILKDAGKQVLTDAAKSTMKDGIEYLKDPKGFQAKRESDKLERAAKDAENFKKRNKVITDYLESPRETDYDREEAALKKEATLAGYRKTIADAKKATEPRRETADEAFKRVSKEREERRKERQDLEGRASRYKKNGLTVSQIAKRMGLTKSEVKNLLYIK